MLGLSSGSGSSREVAVQATRTVARPRASLERIPASRLKFAQNLETIGNSQGGLVFYREMVQG